MSFEIGDRVRVRADLNHWSAGELGTIKGFADHTPYPISVQLDCETPPQPVGYQERELELVKR